MSFPHPCLAIKYQLFRHPSQGSNKWGDINGKGDYGQWVCNPHGDRFPFILPMLGMGDLGIHFWGLKGFSYSLELWLTWICTQCKYQKMLGITSYQFPKHLTSQFLIKILSCYYIMPKISRLTIQPCCLTSLPLMPSNTTSQLHDERVLFITSSVSHIYDHWPNWGRFAMTATDLTAIFALIHNDTRTKHFFWGVSLTRTNWVDSLFAPKAVIWGTIRIFHSMKLRGRVFCV